MSKNDLDKWRKDFWGKSIFLIVYRDKDIWVLVDLVVVEECVWGGPWNCWGNDSCNRAINAIEFIDHLHRWEWSILQGTLVLHQWPHELQLGLPIPAIKIQKSSLPKNSWKPKNQAHQVRRQSDRNQQPLARWWTEGEILLASGADWEGWVQGGAH